MPLTATSMTSGSPSTFSLAGAGASGSDDLGFTYGRYVRFVGSAEEASGYYVHVWQRDDAGAWRITVEVLLPPE